jgi:hypothetical protein
MNRSFKTRLEALESLEAASVPPLLDYPTAAADLFWSHKLGVRLDQPRDGKIRLFLGTDPQLQPVADWVNTHARLFVPLDSEDITDALALLAEGSIGVYPSRLDWRGPSRTRAEADPDSGPNGQPWRLEAALIGDLDRVLFVHQHQTGNRPATVEQLRAWLEERMNDVPA